MLLKPVDLSTLLNLRLYVDSRSCHLIAFCTDTSDRTYSSGDTPTSSPTDRLDRLVKGLAEPNLNPPGCWATLQIAQ